MVYNIGIEDNIQGGLNRANTEKSFTDKLLARRDVEKIGALMRKQNLTRSELNDLLYSITSIETKLINLDEYERYVFGKYFVWIREIVKNTEHIYDLQELIEYHPDIDGVTPDARIKSLTIIKQIKLTMEHSIKFTIDILLYLLRSSLSLGGITLDRLSTNRYEYTYDNPTPLMPADTKK